MPAVHAPPEMIDERIAGACRECEHSRRARVIDFKQRASFARAIYFFLTSTSTFVNPDPFSFPKIFASVSDIVPGSLGRRLRWLGSAVSEATGGRVPAPAVTDIVVTDLTSGDIVLELKATASEAALLLLHVRTQLAEKSVEEFRESWGLRRTNLPE